MIRGLMTDDEWAYFEPFLIHRGGGRPPRNHRRVLDAVFWLMRTGAPWPRWIARSRADSASRASSTISAAFLRASAGWVGVAAGGTTIPRSPRQRSPKPLVFSSAIAEWFRK